MKSGLITREGPCTDSSSLPCGFLGGPFLHRLIFIIENKSKKWLIKSSFLTDGGNGKVTVNGFIPDRNKIIPAKVLTN